MSGPSESMMPAATSYGRIGGNTVPPLPIRLLAKRPFNSVLGLVVRAVPPNYEELYSGKCVHPGS